MKKLYFLASLFMFSIPALADVVTIDQVNTSYQPANVTANVGDVLHFVWSSGTHTTTSATVPAGAASWDSPLTMSDPTFDYTITVPGTYVYVCSLHALSGMGGLITVAEPNSVEPIINTAPEFIAGVDNNSNTLHLQIQNYNPAKSMLKMIDITGKVTEVLFNETLATGTQNFHFDLSAYSKGMYFIRLEQSGRVVTRKIMLH